MNRAKFSAPPKNVTVRAAQNSPSRNIGNENIANHKSPTRPSPTKINGAVATERISPVKNNPFYQAAAPTTPLAPKSSPSVVATPPRPPINTVSKPSTVTTRSPAAKTSPVRPAVAVTAPPNRPATSPNKPVASPNRPVASPSPNRPATSPNKPVASPSSGIQYQQCSACRQSIMSGRVVQAAGMKFHGDCFNCAKCHANISDRYMQLNGQLLCSSCGTETQVKSKPVCHACRDHLVGDCMEANGHHYHTKCFTCYKCRTSLVHSDVYLAGSHISCQRCKK